MGPFKILKNLKKSMPQQNRPSMHVRCVNSYIATHENAYINNFQQSIPFQIINLTSSKEAKDTKVHALVKKCISMLVKPITLFIFLHNF